MAVSLRDVADRAGVARGTVSCILSGRGAEVRISAETQARVRHIAQELGYRPNRLAQGLGRGRTNVIGLMIPGLRNPFFLSVLETAEDRAFRAGFDVLPDSAFQMRARYAVNGKLSGWPMDGILIWVKPQETVGDYLGGWVQDAPVVYLGYQRDDGADYVAIDREVGLREAMDHLRSRGHKRIAYVYPWENLQPVDARYAIYAAACIEAGYTPERILLEPPVTDDRLPLLTQEGLREAGLRTGLRLAERAPVDRPRAVLCHNDLVAIGLCHGLRRAGLSVPEDIAVVGFDGIDEGMHLDRPLTTVVSPGVQLVETALDVLVRRLTGGPARDRSPMQVTLPSVLRLGQTT